MPSPFPGMNPYLEQEDTWHDFHERFCPLCAELLTTQVRPNYLVKIDQHLYIHEFSAEERHYVGRADVLVTRRPPEPQGTPTALLRAPVRGRVPVAVDVERQSYVEIRDRQSRQVITVVELLSPSNKYAGPDRDQYVGKRRELLATGVHLVEIDLLRGGPRLPLEGLPECAYYIMVSRYQERPQVELWPIGLRDPLPTIPIPLREPDPDARLDLQQVLHRIYDAAGYEDYIYAGTPQPQLSAEDAAWAQQYVPRRSTS
jgi:hypothetical protein